MTRWVGMRIKEWDRVAAGSRSYKAWAGWIFLFFTIKMPIPFLSPSFILSA